MIFLYFYNCRHMFRPIFNGLTLNKKLTIIIYIFFFNTIHLSQSIKITDNITNKYIIQNRRIDTGSLFGILLAGAEVTKFQKQRKTVAFIPSWTLRRDGDCRALSTEKTVSIFFHTEWDMIVMTVFLSILNQMEFHLVRNLKENCHHDHIPFNEKENGNSFLSVGKTVV